MANKNYENKNEYTENKEGGVKKKEYKKDKKKYKKKDRDIKIVRKKEECENEVDSDGFEIVGTKEKKQQKQREEKLEELRTAAPTISVTSEAKAVGKAEIEQMDVEVKSPGNNIARLINLGDSKNDE